MPSVRAPLPSWWITRRRTAQPGISTACSTPSTPYEYLDSDGDTVMAEQADRIEAFYRERGLLE